MYLSSFWVDAFIYFYGDVSGNLIHISSLPYEVSDKAVAVLAWPSFHMSSKDVQNRLTCVFHRWQDQFISPSTVKIRCRFRMSWIRRQRRNVYRNDHAASWRIQARSQRFLMQLASPYDVLPGLTLYEVKYAPLLPYLGLVTRSHSQWLNSLLSEMSGRWSMLMPFWRFERWNLSLLTCPDLFKDDILSGRWSWEKWDTCAHNYRLSWCTHGIPPGSGPDGRWSENSQPHQWKSGHTWSHRRCASSWPLQSPHLWIHWPCRSWDCLVFSWLP